MCSVATEDILHSNPISQAALNTAVGKQQRTTSLITPHQNVKQLNDK